MTRRFKRKTLAISIAAALFGGMALAVAPVMTPIAWANQFEAGVVGTVTMTNLYTGEPTTSAAARTGQVRIESGSPQNPWKDNYGRFTMTFPAGTVLWDRFSNVPIDLAAVGSNSINAFYTRTTGGGGISWFTEPRSVIVDGSGRVVVTFEITQFGDPSSSDPIPTSFTITSYVHMPTAGILKVGFADVAGDNALGIGNNPALQNLEIATFHDTTALVTAAAPTSVDSGLTNQPVANITAELLVTIDEDYDYNIIFTLDNGTWASVPKNTPENIPTVINPNNNKQVIVTVPGGIGPASDMLKDALVNLSAVAEDTDINVTVTSEGLGSNVAIPNFGTHTVKVARTKGTSGKDVTVGLKTDPTTDVLYVDRYYQTVTNAVTLAEAMPGTLIPNGTLNYTLSTGVFNTSSVLGVAGTGTAPTCAPIGATASAKFECTAAGTATTTAGAWTLTPSLLNSGPFNMNNATVGDLNVTIDGTAWTNWTSNVVKLADVKKATTSTIDGNVAVLRLGGGTVSTQRTLPDIVIQENNAGALIGNEYFVVAIDEGLKLNVLPTTEVKVFDKNDTDTGVTLTSSVDSPSWLIGNGTGDDRGIDIQWTSTLPAANGPYKIVISGLQVEGDPSSTSPGDYNLSVAGSLLNQHVADRVQSDRYAKPYYEIFPAVKVVDNLTTTAWVDASGPIDDLSAYSSILPGIAARDKLGSYYLMLQMPPLFTGDWSLWTLGAAGWTMVTPSDDVRKLCSTMTSYQSGALVDVINMPLVVNTDMTVFKDVSVWTGFGVGAPLPDPMVPCLNMFENSTYWYVYTVQ